MRVGDLQRSNASIDTLQRSLSAIDRAQRQVATGKRVQRPSDAPIDAASITVLRSAEADIERMIKVSALQPALPEDVARVSARLAAGGWPLADPPLG